MKALSEKQAWLLIASEFEHYWPAVHDIGLCTRAIMLNNDRTITKKTVDKMLSRITQHRKKHRLPVFFWHPTQAYAPKRAALARKFARRCK